jgi:hypothetical protein
MASVNASTPIFAASRAGFSRRFERAVVEDNDRVIDLLAASIAADRAQSQGIPEGRRSAIRHRTLFDEVFSKGA